MRVFYVYELNDGPGQTVLDADEIHLSRYAPALGRRRYDRSVPAVPWLPRRARARLGALGSTGAARATDAVRAGRSGERRRVVVPRPTPAGGARNRPYFVVCGDDPLAHRVVEELTTRYGAEVTVILTSKRRNHGPQIARLAGVRVVEAERLDSEAFQAARVGSAAALALTQQDDVGNIHAALTAQALNRHLRLVIRMFNMSLGESIRGLFADCAVISDAEMAAPAFVAAALGEIAPTYIQLSGRLLYVAHRSDVAEATVVCGLAETGPHSDPVLLPRDRWRANLVLAVADGAAGSPVRKQAVSSDAADQSGPLAASAVRTPGRRWWPRRRLPRGVRHRRVQMLNELLHVLVSRKLWLAAAALIGVLLTGTALFAAVKRVTPWDAAYVTLLTAVGGANPQDNAGPFDQIFQSVITLVGISLVPVVTAAVVEAVVNARLALTLGRLRAPVAGHVVVIGLGNVGTRVIRQLHDLGVPVVAIDKTDAARGTQIARELRIPLIVGDASREETLTAASIQTASALVALSTDDVTNLEAALYGRTLNEDLRVVLRLFDGDFANRVQAEFGITTSHSVSFLAAPAFAAAMHERDVIGTIPVERRVVLIARAPVCAGSKLAGAALADLDELDEVRVLAVLTDRGRTTIWQPQPDLVLKVDDLLVVAASRAGFGRILSRGQPSPAE
jgi:Trk K+ transport system NAD-binding subunit